MEDVASNKAVDVASNEAVDVASNDAEDLTADRAEDDTQSLKYTRCNHDALINQKKFHHSKSLKS